MDILDRRGVLDYEGARKGKELLVRIAAMLTRMIGTQVREGDVVYGYVYGDENGNENGHRLHFTPLRAESEV